MCRRRVKVFLHFLNQFFCVKIKCVPPQLPVPLAVLFLMYREQLIPFCSSKTPRLLDKDELAMENQQGAEGTDVEEKEHEAGGKDVEE